MTFERTPQGLHTSYILGYHAGSAYIRTANSLLHTYVHESPQRGLYNKRSRQDVCSICAYMRTSYGQTGCPSRRLQWGKEGKRIHTGRPMQESPGEDVWSVGKSLRGLRACSPGHGVDGREGGRIATVEAQQNRKHHAGQPAKQVVDTDVWFRPEKHWRAHHKTPFRIEHDAVRRRERDTPHTFYGLRTTHGSLEWG